MKPSLNCRKKCRQSGNFPLRQGEPSRGAQVYPGGLWEDRRRADGKNGTEQAAPSAAFMAESPLRKRAGKRKMRSSPPRSQSSYLALVGSFKSSQVKHLQGPPVPQTGHSRARQSRRTAAGTTFMDDNRGAVMSSEEMEIPI